MSDHAASAENDAGAKCRYMEAAYPELDADDSCAQHRHDTPTFALARAMAEVCQNNPEPSDEQVAWFLDDATAVVDDFDPTPAEWTVTEPQLTREPGLSFTLTINGVEYVVQESDWEPAHPVRRSTWNEWTHDDDDEANCQHEWELRSEHDTWVCAWCQAETTSPEGNDRA